MLYSGTSGDGFLPKRENVRREPARPNCRFRTDLQERCPQTARSADRGRFVAVRPSSCSRLGRTMRALIFGPRCAVLSRPGPDTDPPWLAVNGLVLAGPLRARIQSALTVRRLSRDPVGGRISMAATAPVSRWKWPAGSSWIRPMTSLDQFTPPIWAFWPSRRVSRANLESMAGAPGFEPGMTVPKTVALPLGDAPTELSAETVCSNRRLISKALRPSQ